MKPATVIIGVLALMAACSPKMYPVKNTDSVRVVYRERVDTVIATVTIDREVERIITRDTVSRLENTYAISEASVTDGELRHSLESKPQVISKPVLVTVHDTTIIEKAADTIIKEIPRELTLWQRGLQGLGYVFIGILVALLILIIIRVLRKL